MLFSTGIIPFALSLNLDLDLTPDLFLSFNLDLNLSLDLALWAMPLFITFLPPRQYLNRKFRGLVVYLFFQIIGLLPLCRKGG